VLKTENNRNTIQPIFIILTTPVTPKNLLEEAVPEAPLSLDYEIEDLRSNFAAPDQETGSLKQSNNELDALKNTKLTDDEKKTEINPSVELTLKKENNIENNNKEPISQVNELETAEPNLNETNRLIKMKIQM
jgi:hypothetical protein